MKKHRITDSDATALLRGDIPGDHADLAALAQSLSEFRAAAFETTARPSAELLARLDATEASSSVVTTRVSRVTEATGSTPVGSVSRRKRVRRMISWFTGLGVLAKVALAAGVAVAAVGGVGAAGALPGGTQEAFDHLVSVVVPTTDNDPGSTPTTEPSPEPTGSGESARPDNFGGTVSELAHELGEGSDGRQFGKDVSEAAQANGRSTDGTDDATEGDATQSDDGSTHPSGKPDDSPSDQH